MTGFGAVGAPLHDSWAPQQDSWGAPQQESWTAPQHDSWDEPAVTLPLPVTKSDDLNDSSSFLASMGLVDLGKSKGKGTDFGGTEGGLDGKGLADGALGNFAKGGGKGDLLLLAGNKGKGGFSDGNFGGGKGGFNGKNNFGGGMKASFPVKPDFNSMMADFDPSKGVGGKDQFGGGKAGFGGKADINSSKGLFGGKGGFDGGKSELTGNKGVFAGGKGKAALLAPTPPPPPALLGKGVGASFGPGKGFMPAPRAVLGQPAPRIIGPNAHKGFQKGGVPVPPLAANLTALIGAVQGLRPHSVIPPTVVPPPMHVPPPALRGPGGLAPLLGNLVAQLTQRPPAPPGALHWQAGGIAPELAALAEAEFSTGDYNGLRTAGGAAPVVEKKPKLFLLVTNLAPEAKEDHIQQILEQCGEVHGWRRGRGVHSEPLSFGFAQFGDPEAAWKASSCLSKRVVCGHEIKVLVEEQAEVMIQAWKAHQKISLKLTADGELDWELERMAVSCKAAIAAKVEELYGAIDDGTLEIGAAAHRRQELKDRERARVGRVKKRKAWRDAEFTAELAPIENEEKRLRREEKEQDDADRQAEEHEIKEHDDATSMQLAKVSENNVLPQPLANTRVLREMVDKIQERPRDALWSVDLNVPFLRNEKTLEDKLRPWLEKRIDILMGGPQSDLVEYILRRVNAAASPESLINDLLRYLDDNADLLVERMWRMLVFELMRNGLALCKEDESKEDEQEKVA